MRCKHARSSLSSSALMLLGMSGIESPLAMWNSTANGLLNFDLRACARARAQDG